MITKIGTDYYNGTKLEIYMAVGKATKEGELKSTKNGKPLGTVSIAAGHRADSTTIFVTIDGWRDNARAVSNISKGQNVLAIGALRKREYSGKEYWDMDADFCCTAGSFQAPNIGGVNGSSEEFEELPDTDGELPF